MAIVVEEPKPGLDFKKIVTGLIIFLMLGASVYFLFFKTPPLIEVVIPSQFKQIHEMSRINLISKSIFENPVYQNLRDYSSPLTIPELGRANPFALYER